MPTCRRALRAGGQRQRIQSEREKKDRAAALPVSRLERQGKPIDPLGRKDQAEGTRRLGWLDRAPGGIRGYAALERRYPVVGSTHPVRVRELRRSERVWPSVRAAPLGAEDRAGLPNQKRPRDPAVELHVSWGR